jgi:hypothetical protein
MRQGLVSWALVLSTLLLALLPPLLLRASDQLSPEAVEALKKTAPKVYIDCDTCDIEYIKSEITFVNYVRDRNEAGVHILITTQKTGGGGTEYTLAFSGQNAFQGLNDTLKYFTNATQTLDEVRRGLVDTLKMGLMMYVARTPIGRRIEVAAAPPPERGPSEDRWKRWVFSLSGDGYFSGQQSYSDLSWGANFSASKVTPDFKARLAFSSSSTHDRYTYEGEDIRSRQESYYLDAMVVTGLGEHWSVGAFLELANDTYHNIRLDIDPAPAVEYDLFPYSQSTRRQLRFLYKLKFHAVRYLDPTIYDKTRETLLQGDLSVTLDVKEKWGTITTSLEGFHYFQDFSKSRLDLFTSIRLNLLKGFNAEAFGGGSWIHDQVNLFKGEATLEDVLLHRRELPTTYSYFVGFSLNYTFGSIYTNVINPRFGRISSGGVSFTMN